MALIVTLLITLMLPLVIGALFAIADGQEQEWNEELTVSTLGEVIVGVLYFSDLLPTF